MVRISVGTTVCPYKGTSLEEAVSYERGTPVRYCLPQGPMDHSLIGLGFGVCGSGGKNNYFAEM